MKKYVAFLISERIILLMFLAGVLFLSVLINILSTASFLTGIGDIKKSDSLYVKEQINLNFEKHINTDLILIGTKTDFNQSFLKDLDSNSDIKSIISSESNPLLKSIINEKSSIFLIDLKSSSFNDYEKFTPILREKVKTLLSGKDIYVTGNAAFSYDMNYISEKQGKEAELRVLLITVIVLFLAFGSLSGAFIAVSSGFITTLITISLLKIISLYYPLSVFSQNISVMLGLGLSIDYSLLIISRLRKEIKLNPFEQALNNTLTHGGKSVMLSGITVMIGFTALFIPQLNISDSIAIGGSIVSLTAIIISLTYTPLMLYFTRNYLNYPFKDKDKNLISKSFGNFVSKHPLKLILFSIIFLVIMIFPITRMKLSEPDINTMPDIMESKKGFIELQKNSNANLFYPIQIILENKNILDKSVNEQELYNFSQKLKKYPLTNIYTFMGDLKNIDYTNYFFLKQSGINNDIFRELESYFLSKDRNQTLLTLLPNKDIQSFEINNLIKDLKLLKDHNFKVYIGGQPALGVDLITNLYKNFDLMVLFVYLLTFIVLYISYKSILIPVKAILVNTFSVLACYGILVLVFQDGYLSSLWNLKYVPGSIISGIPVILFCIMFSLSMDYEVFLLSSIHEEYQKTKDNKISVINGLINTSGIITKAAMVMFIVFIAFIHADIILIKMLGVGLTFAVLIDSTLIRLILVPSMMNLAGKYNWIGFSDLLKFFKIKI